MTGSRLSPLLDEVDLVVFDKDGTLLDFHAMWGGWAIELGQRLDGATRRPVAGDVFSTIGFDPTTGRVQPGAPLAVDTMAEIREVIAAVIRRWCPSSAAARRAVDSAWFVPDPIATARPLADLDALFGAIHASGRTVALATTDDRVPTSKTLESLGVRDRFAALACGDDGIGVKPDPAMLLAICEVTRIPPERTAILGDTPADLEMGRAAGAGGVIAVLSGVGERNQLAPLADAILPSVAALLVG